MTDNRELVAAQIYIMQAYLKRIPLEMAICTGQSVEWVAMDEEETLHIDVFSYRLANGED